MTPSSSIATAALMTLLLSAMPANAAGLPIGATKPIRPVAIPNHAPHPVAKLGPVRAHRIAQHRPLRAYADVSYPFWYGYGPYAGPAAYDESAAGGSEQPVPYVVYAPALVPHCVTPKIIEISATRAARTRVIYGTEPACAGPTRVSANRAAGIRAN